MHGINELFKKNYQTYPQESDQINSETFRTSRY